MSVGPAAYPGSWIILYIFVNLLIGIIMKLFAQRTGIPYSPLLLIVGVLFGLLAEANYLD
jgi:NhaP-type Na+/H+ or K+/H+ antiporter